MFAREGDRGQGWRRRRRWLTSFAPWAALAARMAGVLSSQSRRYLTLQYDDVRVTDFLLHKFNIVFPLLFPCSFSAADTRCRSVSLVTRQL